MLSLHFSDVVDDSNMKHGRRRMPNKLMAEEDFATVERDLQKQLSYSRIQPQRLSEDTLMSHPLGMAEGVRSEMSSMLTLWPSVAWHIKFCGLPFFSAKAGLF